MAVSCKTVVARVGKGIAQGGAWFVTTLAWIMEGLLPDVLMFGGLAALTVGLWGWDWRVALAVLGVLAMGIAVWHETRGNDEGRMTNEEWERVRRQGRSGETERNG
jgi:hypothetical protein